MNDPLYAVRSYSCERSRASRDSWLKFRADQGMPVVQHLDRFDAIPPAFQKQWAAARERSAVQMLFREEPLTSQQGDTP